MLSDLRESGEIEQDTAVAVLLHRPGYQDRKNRSVTDTLHMDVAKHRGGETWEATTNIDLRYCRLGGSIPLPTREPGRNFNEPEKDENPFADAI